MGYRSDGAYALRREVYDAYQTLGEPFPEFLGECYRHETKEWVVWKYESLKMYPSFPHIAEFIRFKDEIEAGNNEIVSALKLQVEPHAYVRIGEEHEDIEMDGDSCFFYIERGYAYDC